MNIFDLQGTIKLDTSDYDSKLSSTEQSITGFAGKLTGASNTVQGLGSKISGAGKAIAGISVPIGAAMTVATKSAMDFGDSVAKVSTIADESVMSYDQLSQGILQLSNETGRGAGELAEAMYQALSASVDTGHALEFTEQASNLAKAGFLDTAGAVDVLTTVINAYGMSAEDAANISDQLVQVQNDGKTTVNELASAMGQVIPTASALNVPFEQLNASYALMTKQGINTANTTTYLRGMFNELADTGSNVASILQEKTGKSFGELMNSGATLGDVMGILNDSVNGDSEAFLNLWGNTRAGQGALALLNGGIDEFNEETKKMQNATGNVSDALDKLNTPAAQARKAMTQLKNAGIEIGSALLPAVAKVAQGISKMIGAFQKLPAPVKKAIGVIGGIVGALSPVLMIGGKLVSGVGKIIGLIPMIAGGVQTVIGVLSIINPVVLGVIAAIVAVIAVVKNWGTITDWLKGVWESFTSWFSGIWDGIASAISGAWDSVVTAAQGAWDTVTNIIQVAVMFIQEIIGLFAGIFQGIWAQIWAYIGEPVTTAFNAVSTFISGILSAIGNAISTAWNAVSNVTRSVFNSISQFISTVWNAIRNTVSTIAQAVVQAVQNAWNVLSGIATSIWNAVTNAVNSAFSPVKEKVASIADNVKNKIETAWNGLSGKVSSVFNAIKTAMTQPLEAAKNAISNAIDAIKNKFNIHIQGPHISLPRVSVSGSFSLNPPSVPHFSLSWAAKGMDNPLLLNGATIFGAKGNTLFGGGEAGQEMVVGTSLLKNMMADAVRDNRETNRVQNIGTVNIVINGGKDDAETIANKVNAIIMKQYNVKRAYA